MIAGTTLEVELATQVRVVNDLSDPAGVEFATPVPVTVGNKPDVNVANKPEVVVDDADPIRVQLASAIHVQTYEDKSPFFWFRNFRLGTMKDDSDHYMTIGRWDDDDDDSYYFVYERLIIRSTDDDEDWDKCCLLYTSPSPRDRTRSRMPSSA